MRVPGICQSLVKSFTDLTMFDSPDNPNNRYNYHPILQIQRLRPKAYNWLARVTRAQQTGLDTHWST